MHRIVLATRNEDKVFEIRNLFAGLDIELVTLSRFPDLPDVVEDGASLKENAVKKARDVAQQTQMTAFADDTGLEVDALNGAPGIYSARFAGENATYRDNVKKLLHALQGLPKEKRKARFRTVVAVYNNKDVFTVEGVCEGSIATAPKGCSGFGYDSVFFVPEFGCTFAEMGLELKNRISHRAKAFLNLKRKLENSDIDLTYYL